MIEIVNIEDIVPTALLESLSDAVVIEITLDLADAARAEWIRLAGQEFFTTRRDYVNGIQPVVFRGGTATIALVGMLPNLLEQGMDEVDLHETLLGPNVPVGTPGKKERAGGGFYRAIPFRQATPGTGGATGQPMGRPYSSADAVKDAAELGKKVYRAAKKLKPTISKPGGPTKYGGRLPEGIAPKLRPEHATDIYAGMIRQRKKYQKATQTQYMTFRTIAVDAAGQGVGSSPWIRAATPGRNLATKVGDFVTRIAPGAFEAYVGSLG